MLGRRQKNRWSTMNKYGKRRRRLLQKEPDEQEKKCFFVKSFVVIFTIKRNGKYYVRFSNKFYFINLSINKNYLNKKF